jgi:hypothetical protein
MSLHDFNNLKAFSFLFSGLIWLTMSTEKYQSLPQLLLWGIFINYCKAGVIDSTADHADIRGLVTA